MPKITNEDNIKEKLEYFYYYLCKIMFKGIEKPYLKIGEIIKLI